jgi:hypothetical protein
MCRAIQSREEIAVTGAKGRAQPFWAEVMKMNKQVRATVLEARQSMLRVWMAISAIWVTFWLTIAAIVLTTFEPHNPLVIQVGIFSLIVATPPFVLLAIGAASRWIFETVTLRNSSR